LAAAAGVVLPIVPPDRLSANPPERIAEFETALNALKLGVWAWVTLFESEVNIGTAEAFWTTETISFGYGKHKGKWGLLYSTEVAPFPEDADVVPFREAPREHRIYAVEKLPDLIKKLEDKAQSVAEDARKKAVQVKEWVGALRALTQ
jgi:hypothetical protein